MARSRKRRRSCASIWSWNRGVERRGSPGRGGLFLWGGGDGIWRILCLIWRIRAGFWRFGAGFWRFGVIIWRIVGRIWRFYSLFWHFTMLGMFQCLIMMTAVSQISSIYLSSFAHSSESSLLSHFLLFLPFVRPKPRLIFFNRHHWD
ncbi:hypothetical protein SAMN04488123_10283 [Natribacillus halophilus]|uniref:Uncharacterized protein n=1 Tax=Natribacillus halophilus TaxID=549003 RepID=A0A1G8KG63_9BACI|nr:hypothetical protein SAMN04488123_10283 [Natribacillus halophilus]